VDFLESLRGPRAPWEEVVSAAQDAALAREVALTSSVTIREVDPVSGRDRQKACDVPGAATLTPDVLAEVRRPVSYHGMRNYIGRMALPSVDREAHAGWFESRNEQETYRDLLLTRPITQMTTQPLRLEWPFASGVRTHVPDALYVTVDGVVTLLDVTRRARLDSAEAHAVFVLAQATATALGWRYELRGELSAQHQRNVSFVYAHRHAPPERVPGWVQAARGLPETCTVQHAAAALGQSRPDHGALWHLVATRQLFVDLTAPIRIDSRVQRRPLTRRSSSCQISL
jgi:hypothetical protein